MACPQGLRLSIRLGVDRVPFCRFRFFSTQHFERHVLHDRLGTFLRYAVSIVINAGTLEATAVSMAATGAVEESAG